jgi:hypothetical protein
MKDKPDTNQETCLSEPTLSEEDLGKIKLAQVRNLTEKLKAGKVLTRAEMAQLEDLRADGVDIPDTEQDFPEHTKSDKVMRETIRRKIGVSERIAYDWIKRLHAHKSTTKGWHVPEMLAMILERQKAAVTGPNSDLKREELEEKVLILRGKRKQIYGELVDRKEIMARFREVLHRMRGVVDAWAEHEKAKSPVDADRIDGLHKRFCEEITNAEPSE